jgi:hypothetical protein
LLNILFGRKFLRNQLFLSNLITALDRPLRVPGRLRLPRFQDNPTHEGGKVVSTYAPAGKAIPLQSLDRP